MKRTQRQGSGLRDEFIGPFSLASTVWRGFGTDVPQYERSLTWLPRRLDASVDVTVQVRRVRFAASAGAAEVSNRRRLPTSVAITHARKPNRGCCRFDGAPRWM